MKQTEGKLYKAIKAALERTFGGFWVKIHGGPFQRGGLPDLIGCVQGQFIALEVKLPGGKPTELQARMLEILRQEGAVVGVVTSKEEAIAIVGEALGWRRTGKPERSSSKTSGRSGR